MPVSYPEYLIMMAVVLGVPIAIGWVAMAAIHRRDKAASSLAELSGEVRALQEQAALLAQELEELVEERRHSPNLNSGSIASPSRRLGPDSEG